MQIINIARGVDATYHATSVSHAIEAHPDGHTWLMDLTFEPTTAYNLPLQTGG